MSPIRDDALPQAAGVPEWLPEGTFWLLLGVLFAAVAGAVGVWMLLAQLRLLTQRSSRFDVLEEIRSQLQKLAQDRDDLDLRRLEHVLLDLRDGQQRVEDAMIRAVETGGRASAAQGGESTAVALAGEGLAERVINRLLALGYERVQIVTRPEKLVELAAKDGEILVEARRDGAVHKGRLLIRSGRIGDIEIHPSYSIFP